MTAKEIYQIGMDWLKNFNIATYGPALNFVEKGVFEGDILNTNGCAYYQATPGIIRAINPKQVVELGSAMGAWALMALQELKEGKLYSITLPEHGLEFSYIKENYPNLVKVLGNDLTPNIWPKDLDLGKTDLWFFDSEHSEMQLNAELKLYEPHFKKGAVVLFDDIHINDGLQGIWDKLRKKYDSYDATDPYHYSGFGIIVV